MRRKLRQLVWFFMCAAFVVYSVDAAVAKPLNLAVAANFAEPAGEIAEAFTAQYGHEVVISVSSSGTLFAQISRGAPFDVFLSADTARPEKLVRAGEADASTLHTYAQGRLAYLNASVATPSAAALRRALSEDKKLAIANPRLAPYGLAAKQMLSGIKLWDNAKYNVVMGKNVLQAYQYYRSKNVEHAFVAASLVSNKNHAWLLPLTMHAPILQSVVVPNSAKQPALARKFVHFLMSDEVQHRLPEWGYLRYRAPEVVDD